MNHHTTRRIAPKEALRVEHLVQLAAQDERVRERKSPEELRVPEHSEAGLISHYAQSKAGVYVAEVVQQAVGIGSVPLRSENGIIYVLPEFRGNKIGTGLINAINAERKEHGIHLVHPDRVFGHAVAYGRADHITGGW